MSTHDAGAGRSSRREALVPGGPQAAEPELNEYGLPVQQRRRRRRTDVIAAAIADARTNILPDEPGTSEPVRIATLGARITYSMASIVFSVLLPLFGDGSRPVSNAWLGNDRVPVTIGLGVLGACGIVRAWRIALLADRDSLTIRNFLRTYRLAWHDVAEFSDGSTYAGAESAWALRVSLKDGRVIIAHATAEGRPSTAANLIKIARQHNIPESLTGRNPTGSWRRPRGK